MSQSRLASSALLVAAGMLLGRCLGLLRELSLAGKLGVTRDADLAMLTISLPDLLNALFIGGAVSAVLVPQFHRLASVDRHRANQFFVQFLTLVGLGSGGLALFLWLGADGLVTVLAPGLGGTDRAQAISLFSVVLIAFPICTLTAVTAAALQAEGRVAMPALGTFIFNVVVVLAILLATSPGSLAWLAMGIILAAVCRFGSQLLACFRGGLFRNSLVDLFRFRQLEAELGPRYLEALAAVGIVVFMPVIARAFASHSEGGVASLNYSLKLLELPVGLIGAILTMVVFPRVSRAFNEKNAAAEGRLIGVCSALILVITVPCLVGMQSWALPGVKLLLGRGRIESADLILIADLTRLAFVALPAAVATIYCTTLLHARRDTRTPFLIGLAVAAGFVATLFFVGDELRQVVTVIAAAHWCYAVSLAICLYLRHGLSLASELSWGRLLAGLAAGGLVAICSTLWEATDGFWSLIVQGGLMALGAAAVMVFSCWPALTPLWQSTTGSAGDAPEVTPEPVRRAA